MPVHRLLRQNKQQLLALAATVVVVVVLAFSSENFFTLGNGLNIGKQASINLIIALGMTVVILSGGIDLSVGSLLAVTIVTAAILNDVHGVNIWFALLAGCSASVLLGAVNGIVIHHGRVPAFIATLGMMGIARGLVLLMSKGHPAMTFPPEVLQIADGAVMGVPGPIAIAIVMSLGVSLLLRYTSLGRGMYALGGNEEAARLSGIPIGNVRIAAYALSGFCCAVAGIIFAARVGAPPPSSGAGYELNAIAAVIIGGTSLSGGTGKVFGTVIGALLMAIISNGLTITNVDPYWQNIIVGLIIVSAVMLSSYRSGQP